MGKFKLLNKMIAEFNRARNPKTKAKMRKAISKLIHDKKWPLV